MIVPPIRSGSISALLPIHKPCEEAPMRPPWLRPTLPPTLSCPPLGPRRPLPSERSELLRHDVVPATVPGTGAGGRQPLGGRGGHTLEVKRGACRGSAHGHPPTHPSHGFRRGRSPTARPPTRWHRSPDQRPARSPLTEVNDQPFSGQRSPTVRGKGPAHSAAPADGVFGHRTPQNSGRVVHGFDGKSAPWQRGAENLHQRAQKHDQGRHPTPSLATLKTTDHPRTLALRAGGQKNTLGSRTQPPLKGGKIQGQGGHPDVTHSFGRGPGFSGFELPASTFEGR